MYWRILKKIFGQQMWCINYRFDKNESLWQCSLAIDEHVNGNVWIHTTLLLLSPWSRLTLVWCNYCIASSNWCYKYRGVVPGGAGGAMAPPDFGRSVNPISTRGDRLCPPNYYWHPRIFRPSDGPVNRHNW